MTVLTHSGARLDAWVNSLPPRRIRVIIDEPLDPGDAPQRVQWERAGVTMSVPVDALSLDEGLLTVVLTGATRRDQPLVSSAPIRELSSRPPRARSRSRAASAGRRLLAA